MGFMIYNDFLIIIYFLFPTGRILTALLEEPTPADPPAPINTTFYILDHTNLWLILEKEA